MAGPAIRAWHLAHELAAVRPVLLATPRVEDVRPIHPSVTLVVYDRADGSPLAELAGRAAAVVASGYLLRRYPDLGAAGRPLAIDLYDPFVLENLVIHACKPLAEQRAIHQGNLEVLADQLGRGDFFVCASEMQRDFWLGMLTAEGRLNPDTLADDPTLRKLIDVVPFGLPAMPPAANGPAIKGVVPGIGPADRVIYWGGGIWEWFDALSAVKAVAQMAEERDDVRLFFAGVRHPSPDVPPMRMCRAAMELSNSLGLTGRVVFFNDWIPYDRRGAYLLEADLGISLHLATVETHFSFRTRLLDYLWAGLPMVVTRGDAISRWVEERNLGRVVDPGDVGSLAAALLELLDTPNLRASTEAAFEQVRAELHWDQVAKPMVDYCAHPYYSADHMPCAAVASIPLWKRAWMVLRDRGVGSFLREIRSYVNWRLQRSR